MALDEIVKLRRALHQHPELSGSESGTAGRISGFFEPLNPDTVLQGLGGHGLAYVFSGAAPGPTVLLRCDMDALPIQEVHSLPYQSLMPGVAHKCGHDGHMAILASVGMNLSLNRPAKGRAVLLFQPAEENGSGARAVLQDPRFAEIRPDVAFALHNLPGFPLGEVVVRSGTFCCASRGMTVKLRGTAAHAAQPETGLSPAEAMCRIIRELGELPSRMDSEKEFNLSTVVGARLGKEVAFGTLPGEAMVMATLRSETEGSMAEITEHAKLVIEQAASRFGLEWEIGYTDIFPATLNSPKAVDVVRRAAVATPVREVEKPFRWSEDFGHFTSQNEGALFGIGAGEEMPQLHHPAYDFPDELILPGCAIFMNILKEYLY
jgi:amidohydrolase